MQRYPRQFRPTFSKQALRVKDIAEKAGIVIRSDPSWSEAEAASIETPQGECHLHWMNHRGVGHWNIVKHNNQLCKTVRCRKVTIIVHGGENEASPINIKPLEYLREDWMEEKDAKFYQILKRSQRVGYDQEMEDYR